MIVHKPLRRCAALGAAALLALAGCSGGGGGRERSAEDQIALTELSNRLVEGGSSAYTAEYLVVESGESVLVAVDQDAGTAAVVVGEESERWSGANPTELELWLGQRLSGLVPTDEDVASWLSAAAIDPTASTTFSDTTLAGELADCVDVQGAAESPVGSFEVCVTTGGVVAKVTAKVGDNAYGVKLVNYHDGVDAAWVDGITGETPDDNG
ncbi:hypothetical protein [Glycomyces sp. NRRL B-16210]|uniref:hypothetical protein n=1 Tax=Glycomyces sp. NRRL B-16210 TaxID=1463821 RepID=UPI0004BF1B48|nr:hypothetical protein [Glycomyces sp. NRRL B-16210]